VFEQRQNPFWTLFSGNWIDLTGIARTAFSWNHFPFAPNKIINNFPFNGSVIINIITVVKYGGG
jgi:hypothetical protein